MNNKLRSANWFGRTGKDGFIYRAWMKNQGIPDYEFNNKPVIGICNTWSELTPCNAHFRELAESVKRGIYEAGGFPVEFPVMSLGETLMKPTTMLYRNLASMDVEESIRANPLDGVVLLCGCDKTTPSLVMGACSVNLPTIVVSGGPMLTGRHRGKSVGTSDLWRYQDELKENKITEEELISIEGAMCRSRGHCAVMGTASTMACMVESLGLSLPGNAAIPAADARRKVLAQMSGLRIVEMVKEDMKLSDILTKRHLKMRSLPTQQLEVQQISSSISWRLPEELASIFHSMILISLVTFRSLPTSNHREDISWRNFIMPVDFLLFSGN